jgi:hypothetical protein
LRIPYFYVLSLNYMKHCIVVDTVVVIAHWDTVRENDSTECVVTWESWTSLGVISLQNCPNNEVLRLITPGPRSVVSVWYLLFNLYSYVMPWHTSLAACSVSHSTHLLKRNRMVTRARNYK